MLVLGHRGYHVDVPENTGEAFERALQMGVDGFETDVRLSADGVALLFHNRIAPNGHEVAALSQSELRKAVGYEVPTLESMVRRWPDAFWNIEIKTPAAVYATAEIVRRYCKRTQFVISFFWHPLVSEFCRSLHVDGGFLVSHRPLEISSLLTSIASTAKIKSIIWDFETVDEELLRLTAEDGVSNWVYGAITASEHLRLTELAIDCVITDHPELVTHI